MVNWPDGGLTLRFARVIFSESVHCGVWTEQHRFLAVCVTPVPSAPPRHMPDKIFAQIALFLVPWLLLEIQCIFQPNEWEKALNIPGGQYRNTCVWSDIISNFTSEIEPCKNNISWIVFRGNIFFGLVLPVYSFFFYFLYMNHSFSVSDELSYFTETYPVSISYEGLSKNPQIRLS